ncbi:ferritin-like domain-containing protein [Agrobacterium larrymoorei]|uniref:Ferritin-like protein n=1 Tax=Agrobacterium larrymoorei TaxID=160699 RepID=A0AAF0HG08_9HYPH|nr:ferritin-like protein [Agrobacterium larrymoorei]WHA44031.1 ferritin-like protein [Agrobacterium larrymoorei]
MPSPAIKTLDELKEFLYRAMQLEHATIPPYLTALYSIKPGVNQAASQVLRVVVVEEMLHLTLAANLLNAIGGTPDLTKPGFVPTYPAYLPDGEEDFQVGIAAFSLETIETFLKIERPAERSDAARNATGLIERSYAPEQTVLVSHPDSFDLHYYSIGEFYEAIAQGFEFLENEANRNRGTIFVGDASRQITSEYYYSGGGELHPVTDLKSALSAIHLIIEQGEGEGGGIYDDGTDELAHYYRFNELKEGRYYQRGDEPEKPTGPALQVDWDGAYPVKPNLKVSEIPEGSELHSATVAFNTRYSEFLALLTRAYNGEPKLLLEAVPLMFEFRNLMLELLRNPLPNHPGLFGSPTFEIPGVEVPVDHQKAEEIA